MGASFLHLTIWEVANTNYDQNPKTSGLHDTLGRPNMRTNITVDTQSPVQVIRA